jgi:hypothetical protein
MIIYNIYKVTFQVGYSKHIRFKGALPSLGFREKPYEKILLAKDLDDVINSWSEKLMKWFPFEDGAGGSHYYTDPFFGDTIKFVSIILLHENVLSKDNS